jgi:hypothetical protein
VAGLGEINAYKTLVKARNIQLEDIAVAATITELMALRDVMVAQLIHLKCDRTLLSLDNSTRNLFASSAQKFHVSSFSTLLLPHVEDPSLLLRKALIAAAEVAWDAQLWTLRTLGCEVQSATYDDV